MFRSDVLGFSLAPSLGRRAPSPMLPELSGRALPTVHRSRPPPAHKKRPAGGSGAKEARSVQRDNGYLVRIVPWLELLIGRRGDSADTDFSWRPRPIA